MNVSVIILVYNRPDLMKKTIFSLNAQSLLPSEVIVTDDGSNVDMLGALKEISSKLRFELKYVRQNHRGFRAAKARNNGVRFSKNEYLVFYDQDIISTKNYLSKFVENSDPSKFIVSYPIRLTEVQTALINENMIADCDFDAILFAKQKLKIKKQFMKDYYSHLKKNLGLNKKGPKLRSGVFALFKEKFVHVNGFDEKYKGWGNEDDDLGHRLYAAGVNGFNPFWNEYPLHLFHEANHESGKRVNAEYYNERKRIINEGNFTCQFGLENPNDDEEIFFLEIN